LKLAAIDIGSNAVRLQISAVLVDGEAAPVFKKIEYVRFPLRLGQDVFIDGMISEKGEEKFMKLMQAIKLLLELFEVDSYYACATSALRSSSNGRELVDKVLYATGIVIDVIDGEQEASLIDLALRDNLPDGPCLHIDVGGGSTELNLYNNQRKLATQSFSLGSVRNKQGKDLPQDWKLLQNWLSHNIQGQYGELMALGTGGNISKLYNMSGKKDSKPLPFQELQSLRSFINGYSIHDRLHKLRLNPDRADVIIPAADIYLYIMERAQCPAILVPNIGLKDGLIKWAFQQQR
jgi:exopolyphosphatase/guanosine-5'-triphosphate,3'-diphosphate pyrophosphatase